MTKKRYRKGEWDGPNNWTCGYTFKKEPTSEDLAWKLLDYIELCDYAGVPATKKEFLLDFLGKKLTKRQLPGHLSSLFGAVQDAGIVQKKRDGRTWFYIKGINADCYRDGTLKCTKTVNRNAAFRKNIRSRRTTIIPISVPNTAVIEAGSVVLLVGRKDLPSPVFEEDQKYADTKQLLCISWLGDYTFVKRLNTKVAFDGGDMQYAPSRDYEDYDPSPFTLWPYAFLTRDRWGGKWEMMCVKERDLIWK